MAISHTHQHLQAHQCVTCHALTNKAVLGAVFDGLLLAMQAEQDRMCERGLLDVDQEANWGKKTRDSETKDREHSQSR